MRSIITILISCLFLAGASKCERRENSRQKSVKTQETIARRAATKIPIPQTTNFLNRKAIAEYMKRMDDPSKTFYVYLLSMTGKVIGYYVTRTHPRSVCDLMTPPDRIYDDGNWGSAVSAPTLDGTYGSSCNQEHYYAITADTDTLIEFSMEFFISDQPLNIEADQISAAE